MEKGPGSHSDTDAPARLASQEVLGDPGAATSAAASNSCVAAPTQVPQRQETSPLPHPGRDNQRLRTCVQPLPLRPIALESSLASQQRRNQYSGSTHQQLLRSHPGYQFSPARSPSTPTTNDSRYAPSHSPSLSSVRSEPPGCAGTDFFNRSRADGQAVQVGRLLTGFTRTGVMGLKSAAVGPSTVAVLGEVASGQTRPHAGPRKFSPNIDASRNGGCSTKGESDCSSIANLKEESTAAPSSCLGIDEGLLTRTLLQAMQNKSHGPAKAENDTSAKDCSGGVSTGTENVHRPHGHAGKTGQNGTDAPSHLRASVRIMESNVRLLYQQLRSSKDGPVKKEKKSKDLLELSWVGGDARDENGTSGLYTPLTLPFIVKEDVEEEEEEHKEHRTPDGEPAQKMRPRRTRRPTARHVEEANRFAAGLLLAEDGPGKSAGRANSDTWDFADDEGSKGVEFLHICFPFAFPPLDRQAMMEAEGLRAQQVRRCHSGSTTDSGDGHACSGSCNCTGTATKSRGKSNSTNFPLRPSPPLRLPELPAGRIGRLLVHRSGRVKLRLLSNDSEGNTGPGCASQPLPKKVVPSATSTTDSVPLNTPSEGVSAGTQKSPGETSEDVTVKAGTKCQLSRGGNDRAISFEVNVGSECTFAQDVGCFFRDTSEFVFLGRCNKRLVVAPDIKSWLANIQRTPAAAS